MLFHAGIADFFLIFFIQPLHALSDISLIFLASHADVDHLPIIGLDLLDGYLHSVLPTCQSRNTSGAFIDSLDQLGECLRVLSDSLSHATELIGSPWVVAGWICHRRSSSRR